MLTALKVIGAFVALCALCAAALIGPYIGRSGEKQRWRDGGL